MLEISNLMHLCFIRGRSTCYYSRQHFHPGLEKVSNSLLLQDTVAVRQGVVLPLLYHKIYEGWALVFSPVHHISHIIHLGLLINRSSIMPTYYKLSGLFYFSLPVPYFSLLLTLPCNEHSCLIYDAGKR